VEGCGSLSIGHVGMWALLHSHSIVEDCIRLGISVAYRHGIDGLGALAANFLSKSSEKKVIPQLLCYSDESNNKHHTLQQTSTRGLRGRTGMLNFK